jgi:hypothetical protein
MAAQGLSSLSNLQQELLKLYACNVSDDQILEIRQLLADYFAQKIDREMNQLWQEKSWNEQTIESWKQEHLRSSKA